MFNMFFFERQAYRKNISAFFYPSQVHEKLLGYLNSKIEDFQTKFPNFLQDLSTNQKQNLFNDLFVLDAYDFIDEKLFQVVTQMPRPLIELHQRALEVKFLMNNYSEFRNVYVILMILFRKGKLKPNQLLSAEVKEALTILQEKHQIYFEHEYLIFCLTENGLLDDKLIVSALHSAQPYILGCIFSIYQGLCTPKMAKQFFKQVKNWEGQSEEFINQQLQLLKAMEFFKQKNHRFLLESGLFDWIKTSKLIQQQEFFNYFHPKAPHFENVLAMPNPSACMGLLLKKAHVFMKNPQTIDQTLEVFFRLVSIYPDDINIHMLTDALNAALKFNHILDDLKHPVLKKISARMWQKLIDIALIQQTDIDEKAKRFIECLEQGQRFMNYEINSFSLKPAPVSVAGPVSPKSVNFESEDLVSSQRNSPK
jgi:hypothetical protein